MKKPRSDSLYAALKTPDRRKEVFEACSNGMHLERIVELCGKKFGVVTSPPGVSRFYSNRLQETQEEQIQLAKDIASHADDGGEMEKGINAVTRQKLFEAVLKMDPDPKVLLALRKIELAEQSNELARRRLKLLEEQNAEAKQKLKGVLKKGGISEETRSEMEAAMGLL